MANIHPLSPPSLDKKRTESFPLSSFQNPIPSLLSQKRGGPMTKISLNMRRKEKKARLNYDRCVIHPISPAPARIVKRHLGKRGESLRELRHLARSQGKYTGSNRMGRTWLPAQAGPSSFLLPFLVARSANYHPSPYPLFASVCARAPSRKTSSQPSHANADSIDPSTLDRSAFYFAPGD